MAKLTVRIAASIILTGLFCLIALLALSYQWTSNFYLNPGFYVTTLFIILSVFFFGIAVGQNLSSHIKKILDEATKIREGNLSSRVYLETKDELAELESAIEPG